MFYWECPMKQFKFYWILKWSNFSWLETGKEINLVVVEYVQITQS